MREMKDSGNPYIGRVPCSWKVAQIKNCIIDMQDGTHGTYQRVPSPYYLLSAKNLFEDGLHIGEQESSISHEDYLSIIANGFPQKGDIGICCVGTIGRCCIYNENIPHAFQRSVTFIRPSHIVDSRFLLYSLRSPSSLSQFNLLANTSAQSGLYMGALSTVQIPFPPREEQYLIANFLDRKCIDIDKALKKTRSSIEEYKKLKQSVITEAVTKGIRGERPMKDSGSTWFGKIPASWDAKKLKYTFTIRKRIVGEDGHIVLAITQKGVKPKDMSNGNGQFAESYTNYQIVHPGDFAMNHMDLLTGWVDISKYEGVTSPDYRVFTLDDTTRNCPGYYLYMMQMCYSNRIFYSMGQGVSGMGRWRLPADMFNNFIIACPPYEEQKEIAEYLDKKCSEIDSLITSKEKFITELESYKKSLIYEYVTGKKEVPEI